MPENLPCIEVPAACHMVLHFFRRLLRDQEQVQQKRFVFSPRRFGVSYWARCIDFTIRLKKNVGHGSCIPDLGQLKNSKKTRLDLLKEA